MYPADALQVEDDVPRLIEHFLQVPVRRDALFAGQSKGDLHGGHDVHAHFGTWWRGPEDARLHTAYFCACFYGCTGPRDFPGEDFQEALGLDLDVAAVSIMGRDPGSATWRSRCLSAFDAMSRSRIGALRLAAPVRLYGCSSLSIATAGAGTPSIIGRRSSVRASMSSTHFFALS